MLHDSPLEVSSTYSVPLYAQAVSSSYVKLIGFPMSINSSAVRIYWTLFSRAIQVLLDVLTFAMVNIIFSTSFFVFLFLFFVILLTRIKTLVSKYMKVKWRGNLKQTIGLTQEQVSAQALDRLS